MRRETARRLRQLIEDMERQGYEIGMDAAGTGCFIRFPDRPLPQGDAMIILNAALDEDKELDRAWMPFLKRHRPYSRLVARVHRAA